MDREKIIDRIFQAQEENGCWKMLEETHRYYPDYLHYSPNYKATLWTLILLADLGLERTDSRVQTPLKTIQDHFFDPQKHIFSLKADHFPIPCLNGNMIYLDANFHPPIGDKSLESIKFFANYQRFDDGEYDEPKNQYCSNKSCFGKHSCYWGIVKLLKGLSFIPSKSRSESTVRLINKCIDFVLLHKVCFSSRDESKIMINKMDYLTFPNMYKSDFLEILWLLKREGVRSEKLNPALDLLRSKRLPEGLWKLERKLNNLTAGVGEVNQPNAFITERAREVLDFYSERCS